MRALALVTDAFGGHGGIAQYNRHFLAALCQHPQCVEVVALPRLEHTPIEPLPERLTWSRDGLEGKAWYFLALARRLATDRRFDIIFCGHINLLPAAVFAKLVTGAPLILQIHGTDAWKPTRNAVANYLAPRVDLCLAVSRITRRRFLSWSNLQPHKCVVLPNTIPDGVFSPGPKNAELLTRYGLHGRRVLMTFGRLEMEERFKGFDEVMEALPILRHEFPHLVYLIAGDGSDRERLQEKAKRLGLADRVVFAGHIPESEKTDHYRLADVYVMPSWGEGFGIVLLEALASGIPVVASLQDGSQDAVRDGEYGALVDPDDIPSIVQAVRKALDATCQRHPPEAFIQRNYEPRLVSAVDLLMSHRPEHRCGTATA